jgi:hypothetical protein
MVAIGWVGGVQTTMNDEDEGGYLFFEFFDLVYVKNDSISLGKVVFSVLLMIMIMWEDRIYDIEAWSSKETNDIWDLHCIQ